MSAGALFANAALEAMNTVVNYGLSSKQAETARKENYLYNEAAAQNADARTRKLYEDFYSPEALMRQYAEAGLSPSLMFGGTPGQGGMSGAQGAGAAGPQAMFAPMDILKSAQAAALMSQAKKTNAEANTIEGKNVRGLLELANLEKQNGNIEASTALLKANKAIADAQAYVAEKTKDFDVNKAYALTEKAMYEMQIAGYEVISAMAQAEVDEKTVQARIDNVGYQNQVLVSQDLLNKATANAKDAEAENLRAEINKWQKQLELEAASLIVQMYDAQTRRQFNQIIDDYYDAQVEYLDKNLKWDKDKFKDTFGLDKDKFIWSIVNGIMQNTIQFAAVLSRH